MKDKDRRQHQWWLLSVTLKTDRNKSLPFVKQNKTKQKHKIVNTYLKWLIHITDG